MVEKSVVVAVEPGLQADKAAKFVREANRFAAEIYLEKKGRRINAKSIMGVLSLAIASGDTITLFSDGSDGEEAIDALVACVTETN
ncbi:MAG: HPr family phosphocarrier protein [Amphibacillus sp.]|uniref:HPr-like protein Crh n=1 Tax=Amphibacillus xylanus (strain ATCC 51415 / DSM 6626 / JCM 7361 / LMG 17667 / NBRC 15112 / Ep01) TaxID=698758 RepID=K0J6R6_AMPXN|nr:HPr family phosphocarrier protein [Amphibacillus xylanus]NMA90431.1 HPr family phosphocarrier protein [Amphibacillus sp.]BAM46833.1 HPr-like protein Crh [Amphibacillus xylanus NBRC 15112]